MLSNHLEAFFNHNIKQTTKRWADQVGQFTGGGPKKIGGGGSNFFLAVKFFLRGFKQNFVEGPFFSVEN